ncbi:hypothetical protein [Streptomyces sp. NBC_01481]|uniref:hypothetical protein n=1 Tax=Streptomyces sp. NBC_01481 TaxID=2975869 RepID=UPI00225C2DA1|nr:hypothetical protein [Streptomyces sp. NBC_01481]MCX4588121.1 hypothetical protein [Streptomyces sp. NBC_01481]
MMINERAQKADDRLSELAREISEYESGRKKCDRTTLQLSLLNLRKQELSAMRELQEADPSFRPGAMAEGIVNIQREIGHLEHSLNS